MSAPGTTYVRPRRRPHPKLDQYQRTWYFLRRNTLAMAGLVIVLGIAAVAIYAITLPLPWTSVPTWCATDYGPYNPSSGYGLPNATVPGNFTQDCPTTGPIVCTYEIVPPPNAGAFCGGLWYKEIVRSEVPFAGIVAPTFSFSTLNGGPMPLGALAINSGPRTPIYDVATMLARGADWSLLYSVSIVGLGALIGLFLGAVAGYYGGRVDDVLMRLVDIFLSIPVILFVIVLVAVITVNLPTSGGGSAWVKVGALILAFTIVWWPFYARVVRGQVLVVREQKYVEAARASGAGRGRILLRHVIPNSVYPVLIQFSLDVGTVPLLIGTLAFLGFGPLMFASYPFPEWGAVSALSVVGFSGLSGDFLTSCYTAAFGCVIPWWQVLFPGIAIFLYAISVNLLSDGLRDALDPRLRR